MFPREAQQLALGLLTGLSGVGVVGVLGCWWGCVCWPIPRWRVRACMRCGIAVAECAIFAVCPAQTGLTRFNEGRRCVAGPGRSEPA